MTRLLSAALVAVVSAAGTPALAEVTRVSISTRQLVAGGQPFGQAGPYEKLVGRIQFALDPAHPRNRPIVDLDRAPRGTDKRVYFTADLFVLQPADPSLGNGTLLFDIANRGRKVMLGTFNGAPASNDPTTLRELGDGFLMRDGYTLVWIGWQFDVAAPLLSIDAPRADLRGQADTVRVSFTVDAAAAEASPPDLPRYWPSDTGDREATLTVRNRFWEAPTAIARERWRFVPSSRVRLRLDGGFEPGRIYELTYRSLEAQVAGVGFAAVRDAASAFRYRDDLPVRGRAAYAFGVSQSGRFLRQFLAEGFNADERDRRVFDAVWPHIAGAGLGSFNERFAMPGYSSFPATRLPFADAAVARPDGGRGGILSAYDAAQQPKVFYTNSSVEYWGQGRAAALTHASADGATDLTLPDTVRSYLLSASQHVPSAFPPPRGQGQALSNPVPHAPVLRALLRALHQWADADVAPPASRYPRLSDRTLVPVEALRFPAIPNTRDPRTAEGPAIVVAGRQTPLPFLVPQVDADGNELAGVRLPDVAVPLATMTGWNFRRDTAGNPGALYPLIGSYMPLADTRREREAQRDPRPSIEERYRSRNQYQQRVDAAIADLIKGRYLLDIDAASLRERAAAHWEYATTAAADGAPASRP
jgi:hypothetical protein